MGNLNIFGNVISDSPSDDACYSRRTPGWLLQCVVMLSVTTAAFCTPIIAIKSPEDGTVVQSKTWVDVAFRSDTASRITGVELLVDGETVQTYVPVTRRQTGNKTFPVDLSNTRKGAHTITTRATDSRGQTASTKRTLYHRQEGSEGAESKKADLIPPSVRIRYPAQGATLSGKITIRAQVEDNQQVSSVAFYIDGKLHTIRMNAPPFKADWDTTEFDEGRHVLEVRATDSANNDGASAPVTVIVANEGRSAAATASATKSTGNGRSGAPTVLGPQASAGTKHGAHKEKVTDDAGRQHRPPGMGNISVPSEPSVDASSSASDSGSSHETAPALRGPSASTRPSRLPETPGLVRPPKEPRAASPPPVVANPTPTAQHIVHGFLNEGLFLASLQKASFDWEPVRPGNPQTASPTGSIPAIAAEGPQTAVPQIQLSPLSVDANLLSPERISPPPAEADDGNMVKPQLAGLPQVGTDERTQPSGTGAGRHQKQARAKLARHAIAPVGQLLPSGSNYRQKVAVELQRGSVIDWRPSKRPPNVTPPETQTLELTEASQHAPEATEAQPGAAKALAETAPRERERDAELAMTDDKTGSAGQQHPPQTGQATEASMQPVRDAAAPTGDIIPAKTVQRGGAAHLSLEPTEFPVATLKTPCGPATPPGGDALRPVTIKSEGPVAGAGTVPVESMIPAFGSDHPQPTGRALETTQLSVAALKTPSEPMTPAGGDALRQITITNEGPVARAPTAPIESMIPAFGSGASQATGRGLKTTQLSVAAPDPTCAPVTPAGADALQQILIRKQRAAEAARDASGPIHPIIPIPAAEPQKDGTTRNLHPKTNERCITALPVSTAAVAAPPTAGMKLTGARSDRPVDETTAATEPSEDEQPVTKGAPLTAASPAPTEQPQQKDTQLSTNLIAAETEAGEQQPIAATPATGKGAQQPRAPEHEVTEAPIIVETDKETTSADSSSSDTDEQKAGEEPEGPGQAEETEARREGTSGHGTERDGDSEGKADAKTQIRPLTLEDMEHIPPDARIVFEGTVLPSAARPKKLEGALMAPLKHLFRATGGTVYWFPKQKLVRAIAPEIDIALRAGSSTGTLNGQTIQVQPAPTTRDGRLFVTVDVIEKALGVKFKYDRDNNRIVISD